MAKVQKLQVRTPQTTDGKNLAYDKDKKVIYNTSIVELAAKKDFESLNAKLPKHLKHELEVIEVNDSSQKETVSKTGNVKPVADTVLKEKEDEIADLKQKLAEAKDNLEKLATQNTENNTSVDTALETKEKTEDTKNSDAINAAVVLVPATPAAKGAGKKQSENKPQ